MGRTRNGTVRAGTLEDRANACCGHTKSDVQCVCFFVPDVSAAMSQKQPAPYPPPEKLESLPDRTVSKGANNFLRRQTAQTGYRNLQRSVTGN